MINLWEYLKCILKNIGHSSRKPLPWVLLAYFRKTKVIIPEETELCGRQNRCSRPNSAIYTCNLITKEKPSLTIQLKFYNTALVEVHALFCFIKSGSDSDKVPVLCRCSTSSKWINWINHEFSLELPQISINTQRGEPTVVLCRLAPAKDR